MGIGFPQAKSPSLQSVGLLCLRLVMGSAFVLHGLPKVAHATSWLGAETAISPMLQGVAAYSELLGGAALLLGAFTPLASFLLMSTMIGAMIIVHIPAGHPFVSMSESYELVMVYLTAAVMFFMVGPGYYSVDAMMCGSSKAVSGTSYPSA